MPSISVDTIMRVSKINGNSYPMFSGFLNANELRQVAEVPSFLADKHHHKIANDIANPPVDEWQRPLDDSKTAQIRDTYSRADKDNLMANPVLIGIAVLNVNQYVNVEIKQKAISDTAGNVIPIENVYTVTINYLADKKPLWILDGQHRIEGMIISVQKNEPVPFVLLANSNAYTPPFLAEIFTQVTTGATPMKPLHAEWMKYAFRLGKYSGEAYSKSMETTIYLCKEVNLDGVPNPFQNKIQFNPYLTQPGYYAFTFNMDEWNEIIAQNFYANSGILDPKELAAEIVKIIRAFEDLDSYKVNGGSKLFSNDNAHKILAEGFLTGILRYLSIHNCEKTLVEWTNFLLQCEFDKCIWKLPFVKSTGALSSTHGAPSKTIALECFDAVFNDPGLLNGHRLTDYLQGVGAQIKITAYQLTSAGRLSSRDIYEMPFSPGAGLTPFDCKAGGKIREIIKIESITPNCVVVNVTDPNVVPNGSLSDATKRGGLNISSFPPGYEIEVTSMNYSGDTKKVTRIRLDK